MKIKGFLLIFLILLNLIWNSVFNKKTEISFVIIYYAVSLQKNVVKQRQYLTDQESNFNDIINICFSKMADEENVDDLFVKLMYLIKKYKQQLKFFALKGKNKI